MTSRVAVIREVFVSSASKMAVSLTCALMVAGMCIAVLMTTGRTIGAEQAVIESIDEAGSRAILVRAQPGAGLSNGILERLSNLVDIEWAGAFTSAEDYQNASLPGGSAIPVRTVFSLKFDEIGIDPAERGVAYASTRAIELAQSKTPLVSLRNSNGAMITVAHTIDTPDYLDFLEPAVLVAGDSGVNQPVGLLVVVVTVPSAIEPVSELVKDLLSGVDPEKITIETSAEFAALREVVSQQLGWSGRSLVLTLLALTACLSAVVQYGSVLLKRRDFGRRRALGASRSLIVFLVMGQSVLQSALGAVVGGVTAFAIIHAIEDPQPPLSFYLAIVILAILTGVLASIIPALVASRRDPLKELRVP